MIQNPSSRTTIAGIAYFALVFAAGFAMGVIRVPLLVPHLGVRVAELLEMPIMFVVIVLSARFVMKRFAVPAAAKSRLLVGCTALALAVAAELLVAVAFQRQSITQYLASRDPVSGSAFLVMLGVFAAMPFVLARFHRSRVRSTRARA